MKAKPNIGAGEIGQAGSSLLHESIHLLTLCGDFPLPPNSSHFQTDSIIHSDGGKEGRGKVHPALRPAECISSGI